MRIFWILFGVGAHGLFALTVFRLFPFLQGEGWSPGLFTSPAGLTPGRFCLNGLLALQFAVVHSCLLLPAVRRRLTPFIPSPQYGCFFCVITCLSLLLTIETWQTSHTALWQLHGYAHMAITAAFVLAWVGLFYSLSLTGIGYQTGWTPWWAWVRHRQPPRRSFEPRGAYRLLRHPIYLSFLGLVWLTPAMKLDRAVLTAIWTVYIFVGSHLKDSRLLTYVGDSYRQYQARVAGYPFFPFGPLGKVRLGKVAAGALPATFHGTPGESTASANPGKQPALHPSRLSR